MYDYSIRIKIEISIVIDGKKFVKTNLTNGITKACKEYCTSPSSCTMSVDLKTNTNNFQVRYICNFVFFVKSTVL